MEFLNVLAAGAAAWVFGALWYMTLANRWMDATGLDLETINQKDPLPYIISFIGSVIVAGMMRHVLAQAGIESIGKAVLTGLGMGLFIVVPWMTNNVLYSDRDKRLIWMDGGYPVFGMAIISLVLTLF